MKIAFPASHAQAMASFLQDLVRIPSLSTHEEAVASRLAEEMRRVGFAIAVADAHPLVLEHAHWRTNNVGGRGAARDVCELILRAQGKLDALLASYL